MSELRRRIVGPDPTIAGSSPATSDMPRSTRVALVVLPRRPPLTAESDVLRRLTFSIGAPDAASSRTARLLRASVTPLRGRARRDEVPPEIRQRITSLAPKPRKNRIASRAARVLD